MRASKTLPVLLVSAFVAACGGAGEDMEETPPAAVETAAAVTAAPECITGADAAALAERPSPLMDIDLSIELGAGRLCYGAPSANGRTVMGELVPFSAPWRIGANEPTTVHLTYASSIGGVDLEPGSYSLYAVPGADEWEFFINPNHERWGVPITDDVRATEIGSFTAEATAIDDMVETLTYRFEATDDNTMGDIVMEWENTQVRFHLHPGG